MSERLINIFVRLFQERGIKEKSPLALLKSFHDSFFWGLDEMHFWGANVGGKLWSIMTDDGKKYQGTSNILFLRSKYRELIAVKMMLAQQNKHSCSSNGAFLGIYNSTKKKDKNTLYVPEININYFLYI